MQNQSMELNTLFGTTGIKTSESMASNVTGSDLIKDDIHVKWIARAAAYRSLSVLLRTEEIMDESACKAVPIDKLNHLAALQAWTLK